jgi:two-component system, LytTR family, response regulator LytT
VVGVVRSRGEAIRLLPRSSILYLQSYGDFVRVISDDGRYLMRETLSELERRWAPFGFVRVHRQYVANLRQVLEVRRQLGGTAELTFRDGQTIPVARRQVPDLSHRLGL